MARLVGRVTVDAGLWLVGVLHTMAPGSSCRFIGTLHTYLPTFLSSVLRFSLFTRSSRASDVKYSDMCLARVALVTPVFGASLAS